MKKIAIVIDEMSIGGIPKACVDFANQLKDYCTVVLLMKRDDGPMMSGLSKEITVKLIQTPGFKPTIKKLKKERNYIKLIKYMLQYIILTRFSNRWVKANELTAKTYGIYEDDAYDCVITYHGMSISQLLTSLYGVKAAKKIAWIHGDHPFEGIHKTDVNSVYRKFDRIFCVSPSLCVRFLSDFPDLANTVESYKNLLLPQRIRKLAEEKITEEFDSKVVNITTVGRVSKEKGQEMIPHVIKILKDRGLKVFWYIVGDGNDLNRIKEISRECGVEDSINFVGSKSNPYPYMKMCDIYVQPSYTEGFCLTVCEAAILGKSIVLTEIAAVAEILENEKTAIFVKPNANSISDGIEKVLLHPEIKNNLMRNISDLDLSNSQEIEKLLRII